ncbi:hypothetical protein RJ639_045843 [Escallonia herrerae]|uniref:protein-S-isoprenylcysteine alpha-carbonyl methylesterase n=1 Tax=Escallonia herrerae TaxID=1293975 RepID=A0AA88W436_9ASTE|nr:hypothetical protein RJ639_045843 [Escallonia herrerae]
MQAQLLPVSNPSSLMPPSLSSTGTLLIRSDGDDDENKIEIKPFLSRSSSYNGVTTASTKTRPKFYQLWRRRVGSDTSMSDRPAGDGRRHSFRQGVGQAASDTFLITRLCFKLLRYLGVGYRWITRFLALGCYSFLLMPGFFQVGYYYFFSSQVHRGIVYGDQPRNRLDLYLPKNCDGPKPVVAFVTGGAWIIGYKAWGSLLGQQLSERDIIVACIDYRTWKVKSNVPVLERLTILIEA